MHKNTFLNEQQKKAIATTDRSLLIVAGAGTGKTRVLTEKIANLITQKIDSKHILALTFTNKAADEMRARIQSLVELLPFIGTFHAFGVHILREHGEHIGVPKDFTIADRDDTNSIVRKILKEKNIQDVSPRVCISHIARIKIRTPSEKKQSVSRAEEIARLLYPEYALALQRSHLLDFEDLLTKSIHVLEEFPNIRTAYNFSYILVDEFQDTDTTQNTLLHLLKVPHTKVIAVGDSDQTIYSWRGARVEHMLTFQEDHAPATHIILDKNYRSTKNILEAANSIISKNTLRFEKNLTTDADRGGPVQFLESHNEDEEADTIIDTCIQKHKQGAPYSSMAILYRANFQSRALELACIRAHIPYQVIGVRFFERAEIKNLLAYCIVMLNTHAEHAYTRIAKTLACSIGTQTLNSYFASIKNNTTLPPRIAKKIEPLVHTLFRLKKNISVYTLSKWLSSLVEDIQYATYLANTYDNHQERLQSVKELIAFVEKFDYLDGETALRALLTDASLGSDQDDLRHIHNQRGVSLMTIHASKGLEFDIVVVAGMEEGLFPYEEHWGEENVRDPEEERRLCYVAFTRAKKELICSYAKTRSIFGKKNYKAPSIFLYDIGFKNTEMYYNSNQSNTLNQSKKIEDYIDEDDSIVW
ncbi:MAG: UvrD-helicase domain-containing protein [Alphaproteobacteria bacterium]|nr:UvrD-helicase domain-containing protein [Alphaproteobacteria bacterium]